MKPRQRSSIQTLFPKPFSLIFQTLKKTPKRLFKLNPKTYFDCCKITRENGKIRTKNLREKLFQMGYIQANLETSRWQQILPELPCRLTARSTAQQSKFECQQPPVDRPVDPNKQRANCSQSVDRSVDRLQCQPACTYLCTSVDRHGRSASWCGRPSGSTVRVDRPNLADNVQVRKTEVKIF